MCTCLRQTILDRIIFPGDTCRPGIQVSPGQIDRQQRGARNGKIWLAASSPKFFESINRVYQNISSQFWGKSAAVLGIGCAPRIRRGKKKYDRRPIENLPTDTSEIKKWVDSHIQASVCFLAAWVSLFVTSPPPCPQPLARGMQRVCTTCNQVGSAVQGLGSQKQVVCQT